MITRNPIGQMRQSSLLRQSPLGGGGRNPYQNRTPPFIPPPPPRFGGGGGFGAGPAMPPPPIRSAMGPGSFSLAPNAPPETPMGPARMMGKPSTPPSFQLGQGVAPPSIPKPKLGTGPNDNASRYWQEMQALSQPTEEMSAYKSALGERPNSADYKPNWMTRIAAGLAGGAAGMRDPSQGVATAMEINRAPYREAMAEYNSRMGTLKEQAELAQDDRKMRYDSASKAAELGISYDKYLLDKEEMLSQNESRERASDVAEQNAESRRISADAAATNAAKRDYSYTPVQGGFMAINKNDPTDRQVIPARTIQEAQLHISQQNANTAVGQLSVSQGNLEVNQERAASEIANREAPFVPTSSFKSAQEATNNEMMNDPKWSKFYGNKKNWIGFETDKPLGPEDFAGQPGVWEDYNREWNARINQKISTRR